MKKIIFLNRYSLYDSLLPALAKTAEVVCLLHESRTDLNIDCVRMVPVRYRAFGIAHFFNKIFRLQVIFPVYIANFERILAKEVPDVLVAIDFYHFSFWQALSYKIQNPEVKLVLMSETKAFPNGWVRRTIFSLFLRILQTKLNHIDQITVYTHQGESFFKKNLPDRHSVLMPVPIDVNVFTPSKEKVWLIENTLNILMNARYASYKRHEDLFLAVKKIKQLGKAVKVTCIGRSNQSKEHVERIVSEHGLSQEVEFLNSVSQAELVNLYQRHDVLVLPSYNEAIGMVVPEAMACGIPTITSDTVGANVYVKDGETGFVHPTGNVDALVQSLKKLYDEELLKKMGSAAHIRITNEFTVEILQNKFLKALKT